MILKLFLILHLLVIGIKFLQRWCCDNFYEERFETGAVADSGGKNDKKSPFGLEIVRVVGYEALKTVS